MRGRVAIGFVGLFIVFIWLDGRAQTNAPVVSGAHRFEKVTDGIFYATASGTMTVGSNSPIIVTDDEALVIDSEITPAAARALVADLKAITNKPVRYVVDSHYHYDHAFGNQVFGPDVQIIGHDNTRRRLLGNDAGAVHVSEQRRAGAGAVEALQAAHRARKPTRSRRRRSSVRSPTRWRIWSR